MDLRHKLIIVVDGPQNLWDVLNKRHAKRAVRALIYELSNSTSMILEVSFLIQDSTYENDVVEKIMGLSKEKMYITHDNDKTYSLRSIHDDRIIAGNIYKDIKHAEILKYRLADFLKTQGFNELKFTFEHVKNPFNSKREFVRFLRQNNKDSIVSSI